MAKHLQFPMIHSHVLIFHRILFNHLNTFGRKVILVYEIVFQQKNMKSAGLWVITMEPFRYSNAHSNTTVRGPLITEHLAFKAELCDSRYITLLL